jgi:exosortase
VPVFVAYVIRERWPKILAALRACSAPGSPRAAGVGGFALSAGAGALLAGASLVFLFGALMRASAGPSQPATLAISAGAGGVVLALLFVAAPDAVAGTRPCRLLEDARLRLSLLFLFPAAVWQVSAPMVSAIEGRLSLFLLGKVTAVVFFVFDSLGLAIEQQGNTLTLPTGAVNVAEACSGIRSFTACLFVGSFLGAILLGRFWKKVLLVLCASLLAVFTNMLRSLFLTAWAYAYGPEAIDGFVHDAAGYAVIGLTFAGLMCLLPLFNMRISFGAPAAAAPRRATPPDGGLTGGGA